MGNEPIVAFTVNELAKRLDLPSKVIRLLIFSGHIDVHLRPSRAAFSFDPVVSRDAAVVFCVWLGLNPMRVM